MNLPSWHTHISEREPDGTWEDCTWDSGLEWYRLCYDRSKPATHAEAQLLRAASGEPATGGSNIGDLKKGILARYKRQTPTPVSGFANLWTALSPGRAAVVQGTMAAFGPTHRLSRFDTRFDGGHAVMVIRLDATSRVWWCDPEGPKTGYKGEWITKAELQSFVSPFAGQHLVADVLPEPPPPPQPTGEDMPALITYTPGLVATVKPTANVRTAPKLGADSILRASKGESWQITGTVKGAVDPDGGSDVWYLRWNAGRWEYTAKSNVTGLVNLLTTAQGELVKAKAELSATGTALAVANQKITSAKTALG